MQFSRLEVTQHQFRPTKSVRHINYHKVCQICESREVAGYVIGSGQYLQNTCLKCYRAARIESKERASKRAWTAAKGARS